MKKTGVAVAAVLTAVLVVWSAGYTLKIQAGVKDGEPKITKSLDGAVTTELNVKTPSEEELEQLFTITPESVSTYAWVNEEQCSSPIKAVALDVQGLNAGQTYKTAPDLQDKELGKEGVLVVRVYSGPWNWMSDETIDTIDKVLDSVYEKYDLADSVPLVLFGRSMGGMGVLNYAHSGKHAAAGVALNCPVTNFSYHCTERPDCACTIYRAYNYCEDPAAAVVAHDPMTFIDDLPKVPYFFVSSEADAAVNKTVHSDVYVSLMREKGYDVTYMEVPNMQHVDLLNHPDALKHYRDFITSFAK